MSKPKEQQRSSANLVDIMFDELFALKDGSSTPQHARAKSSVANTIVAVKRLEMDYARFVNSARSDDMMTGPAHVSLGTIK